MSESDFLQRCENTLNKISEELEIRDKNSKLDVEYSDGILTILIEETSKTYVINRHGASQKIWYSSPFTGADYFSFEDTSQSWIDSKGEKLEVKLLNELQKILN
jgi:iron donor protein CyaY